MSDNPPKTVIVCNFCEATKVASKGAKAYVAFPNCGNGDDRLYIVLRSRTGRWVRKWEAMWRLGNFRIKSLCCESPEYKLTDIDHPYGAEQTLSDLILAAAIHRAAHSPIEKPPPSLG